METRLRTHAFILSVLVHERGEAPRGCGNAGRSAILLLVKPRSLSSTRMYPSLFSELCWPVIMSMGIQDQ